MMTKLYSYDIQIWIAIYGVHVAESSFVGRNFLSGICELKPKNLFFVKKNLGFYEPCSEPDVHRFYIRSYRSPLRNIGRTGELPRYGVHAH